MGSTFADSDFEDTVETQLTFGTASLLGIFFGLVMVCGIFFGFGYSIGRRNGTAQANAALSAPTRMAPASMQPSVPAQPEQSPAVLTPSSPSTDNMNIAAEAPAAPMAVPPIETAHASSAPALVPAAPQPGAKSSRSPAPSDTLLAVAQHAPLDTKLRIPKPSAIQPTLEQADTRIPLLHAAPGPQFTAKELPNPYFVWTPPFDVHRRHGVTHRMYVPVSRPLTYSGQSGPLNAQTTSPRPVTSGPPMVVQIAAMSRADDAEVLASALRQRGFAPSIKSGVEDALYHVEVGPFRRDVAFATRQKLLARGYNATLK